MCVIYRAPSFIYSCAKECRCVRTPQTNRTAYSIIFAVRNVIESNGATIHVKRSNNMIFLACFRIFERFSSDFFSPSCEH